MCFTHVVDVLFLYSLRIWQLALSFSYSFEYTLTCLRDDPLALLYTTHRQTHKFQVKNTNFKFTPIIYINKLPLFVFTILPPPMDTKKTTMLLIQDKNSTHNKIMLPMFLTTHPCSILPMLLIFPAINTPMFHPYFTQAKQRPLDTPFLRLLMIRIVISLLS
jgi:hypothetical protein